MTGRELNVDCSQMTIYELKFHGWELFKYQRQ